MKKFEVLALLGTVLFPLVFSVQAVCANPNPAVSKNESRAVSILFDNFETVFHTAPALLTGTRAAYARGFIREPFGYFSLALDHKNQQLRKLLLDSSDSILLGTKDYSAPDGLGRVVSTRCYVVILGEGRSIDFERYLGKSSLKSSDSRPIWTWSADLAEFGDRIGRVSTLYATQAGETYFVLTNSLRELKVVSDEISSAGEAGVTLSQVRFFDIVQGREFWGYRKFKDAHSRPTATIFNGLKGVEPDAEALILWLDIKNQLGTLRFFSANANDATPDNLHDIWRMPTAKPIGSAEWELEFPVSKNDSTESSVLVWWLFGLGVIV